MKKIIARSIPIVFLLLFSLLYVRPVFAHGDKPRIEISAERLTPGSVLDLRGVDFEIDEEVALVILGPQVESPLGTVTADMEGIFLLTITLPVDLPEGTYVIRGITDDHMVDSPGITVWGTALLEGGEEGPWEEGDTLLAPMPTFPPAVSTPMPEAAAAEQTSSREDASASVPWIAAGIGIVVLAGLLLWRRRRA